MTTDDLSKMYREDELLLERSGGASHAEAMPHLAAAPRLSVVIPVYNSHEALPLLCQRLERVLNTLTPEFEAILVNDGSHDASWATIAAVARSHPWVRGIDLMRNYGQHNALLCGVRAARYDVIVTMDDDLQHPPEEIPKLLDKLAEGYDVVYGVAEELRHGVARNVASRLTKIALKSAMGVKAASHVSAFRAFRASIRPAFERYRNTFVSIDVLFTWGTQRFAAVPVRHDARLIGTSHYTFGMLVRHALNMMTGYSTLPLQLASLVGFAFTVFGIGVLVYVLGRYLITGGSLPGFPFLASIIAIFAGAQLFALGIIGEYIARIHTRTLDRPSYIIRETAAAVTEAPDTGAVRGPVTPGTESATFTPLEWDSDVFGFAVARINESVRDEREMKAVLSQLRHARVRLAYFFCDSNDRARAAVAETAGGILVDRKVTYCKALDAVPAATSPSAITIRRFEGADVTEKLLNLSRQSGAYSRFRTDSRIAPGVFEAIYDAWIRKSINGQIADAVFVGSLQDDLVGMVTVGRRENRCDIGLIAVDEGARGHGLGKALVHATWVWGTDHGLRRAQVVTQQANVTACALYESCGYVRERTERVYHLWLADGSRGHEA